SGPSAGSPSHHTSRWPPGAMTLPGGSGQRVGSARSLVRNRPEASTGAAEALYSSSQSSASPASSSSAPGPTPAPPALPPPPARSVPLKASSSLIHSDVGGVGGS